MRYDFIEIGTSDFDTLIQQWPNKVGLSIEPIKYYLDALPNNPLVTKVNAAVSDKCGTITIYSVNPKYITEYKLPDWIRGCNAVGDYHPTVKKLLVERNIPLDIFSIDTVECLDYATLVERYNITECGYLKIDTEGHDPIIINNIFDYCEKHSELLPERILFESNELTAPHIVDQIITRSKSYNYSLVSRGHDTILKRMT